MERITDELREYVGNFYLFRYKDVRERLADIADRIDANFKAACESEYAAGVMSVPIAVDESKWVKLPVDADGVPIRIGDVMAYEDNTKPKEVVALVPPSVVIVEDGPRFADSCRHYKPPTVEDLLRKFGEKMAENTAMYVAECWDADERDEADRDTIAEYAKKLRLAGDE